MEGKNQSVVSEFVFLGLSNSWSIQLLLFVFSSIFYVASMTGNSLIVFTVASDPHLRSPMYFLLANLSFIDMGVSSVSSPKLIYDLFRKHKVISFRGCVTQIFFIHVIGGVEMVLLIAMAFDRYVAICKPLHYLTIMSPRMCILFSVASWVVGLIHSLVQLAFVVDLPFCGPNVLDSFYCDLPRFIKLACTETHNLEFMVTANSGFISVGSFIILIISYIVALPTKPMEGKNQSVVSEFVFLGLTNSWDIQLFLSVFSSMFYVASMTGNSLIVFAVAFDPHLHFPMYFLLANLSFIDLGVSSVISPR
ncbi:Olfactory receptor 4F3/4F16/4F29 [Microtus ochrogaster]|uniref:Olfactory receptor n=1 Tax=Microtus ochrogaster TaxID=79684 RepID=A0A8J6KKC2_MICOH|nr:Olfactory receptor 4F3/4F16/4F29 [Microtus ochrogaster]